MSSFDRMLETLNAQTWYRIEESFSSKMTGDISKNFDMRQPCDTSMIEHTVEVIDFKDVFHLDNIVKKNFDVLELALCYITTTVYQYKDRYIGVRGVSEVKSDNFSVKDLDVPLTFHEMKEIEIVSYRYA